MHAFIVSNNPKCKECTKTVYRAELISYDNQIWHTRCFKCTSCSKVVSLGAVAMIDSALYCKNCYSRLFKERGTYSVFNKDKSKLTHSSFVPASPDTHNQSSSARFNHDSARQATIQKCSVADCSIPRAAHKMYCARHANMHSGHPSDSLEHSHSNNSNLHEDMGASVPMPSTNGSTRNLYKQPTINTDSPLGNGHARNGSGQQSHHFHSNGITPTKLDMRINSPIVGSSSSKLDISDGSSHPPSTSAVLSLASVNAALSWQQVNSARQDMSPHGTPSGRRNSTDAFPGLNSQDLRAQVKTLQYENASLRHDLDKVKQSVVDLTARVNQLTTLLLENSATTAGVSEQ